jgi:parallel beta-helix repeat protein
MIRKSTLIGIAVVGSFLFLMLPLHTTAITPQTTYTAHASIKVTGNAQLAAISGITGKGISTNPFVLSGFLFNGGGDSSPINISSTTDYLVIENCEVTKGGPTTDQTGFQYGDIVLLDVQNVNVTNNQILDSNGSGIVVSQVSTSVNNVHIENNYLSANGDGIDIDQNSFTDTVSNIFIENNYLNACVYNGISVNDGAGNVFIKNNTILEPTAAYDYSIGNWDAGNGIDTVDSGSNITITLNTISGFLDGINVWNATVTSNTITNSSNSFASINVQGTDDVVSNNICNNVFVFNTATGIWVQSGANGNQIKNNYCTGGDIGIEVDGNSNSIQGNNITTNGLEGIYLTGADNTVSSNTISEATGVEYIDDHGTTNSIGTNTFLIVKFTNAQPQTVLPGTNNIVNCTVNGATVLDVTMNTTKPVSITINYTTTAPAGVSAAPNALCYFTLSANDTSAITFPVTIKIYYTNVELEDAELSPSNITICYFNTANSQWETVTSTVDTANHVITATLNHFSVYALGTKPSSASSLPAIPGSPLGILLGTLPMAIIALYLAKKKKFKD